MFKVICIETGTIHTVYGCNGVKFLLYDDLQMCWYWKDIDGFMPMEVQE